MRLMGVSEAGIKAEIAANSPQNFEIWPTHLGAWMLFLKVQNQWRFGAMGSIPYGLDYPAVHAVLKIMYPVKKHKKLFKKLQYIEAGALSAWRKKTTE